MRVTASLLERWFADSADPAGEHARPTYAQHLLRPTEAGPPLDREELLAYRRLLERSCLNQPVRWESRVAFLVAETQPPHAGRG